MKSASANHSFVPAEVQGSERREEGAIRSAGEAKEMKEQETLTFVLNCTSHEIPFAAFVAALVSPSSRTILPNRMPVQTERGECQASQRLVPLLIRIGPAVAEEESFGLTARIHVRHRDDVVYVCQKRKVSGCSTQHTPTYTTRKGGLTTILGFPQEPHPVLALHDRRHAVPQEPRFGPELAGDEHLVLGGYVKVGRDGRVM